MEEVDVSRLISLLESQLPYEVLDESGTVSIVYNPVELVDSSADIDDGVLDAKSSSNDNTNLLSPNLTSGVQILEDDGKKTLPEIKCINSTLEEYSNSTQDNVEENIVENDDSAVVIDAKTASDTVEDKIGEETIQSDVGAELQLSSEGNCFLQTSDGQIIQVIGALDESMGEGSILDPQAIKASLGDGIGTVDVTGDGVQIFVVGNDGGNKEMFLINTPDKDIAETEEGARFPVSAMVLKKEGVISTSQADMKISKLSSLPIDMPSLSDDDADGQLGSLCERKDRESSSHLIKNISLNVQDATKNTEESYDDISSVLCKNTSLQYVNLDTNTEPRMPLKRQFPVSRIEEGHVIREKKVNASGLNISSGDKSEKINKFHNLASLIGSAVKVVRRVSQDEQVAAKKFCNYSLVSCDDCGAMLHSEYGLKIHRRRYHQVWHDECFVCGKKFMNMQRVRAHTVEAHINDKEFKCRFCAFTCTVLTKFLKHRLVHRMPRLCGKCGRSFKTAKRCRSHTVGCNAQGRSGLQEKMNGTSINKNSKERESNISQLNDDSHQSSLKHKRKAHMVDNSSNEGREPSSSEVPVALRHRTKYLKTSSKQNKKKKDSEFAFNSSYLNKKIKTIENGLQGTQSRVRRGRTHRCYLCFKLFSSASDLETHKNMYHQAKSDHPVRVKTKSFPDEMEEDGKEGPPSLATNVRCTSEDHEVVQVKDEPPDFANEFENVTIVLDESMKSTQVIKPLCIACKVQTDDDFRKSSKWFSRFPVCDQSEALKRFQQFIPYAIDPQSLTESWILCKSCVQLIDRIANMEDELNTMKSDLLSRIRPEVKNGKESSSTKEVSPSEEESGIVEGKLAKDNNKSLVDVETFMKKNCEIMEVVKPQRKRGRPRKKETEKLIPIILSGQEDEDSYERMNITEQLVENRIETQEGVRKSDSSSQETCAIDYPVTEEVDVTKVNDKIKETDVIIRRELGGVKVKSVDELNEGDTWIKSPSCEGKDHISETSGNNSRDKDSATKAFLEREESLLEPVPNNSVRDDIVNEDADSIGLHSKVTEQNNQPSFDAEVIASENLEDCTERVLPEHLVIHCNDNPDSLNNKQLHDDVVKQERDKIENICTYKIETGTESHQNGDFLKSECTTVEENERRTTVNEGDESSASPSNISPKAAVAKKRDVIGSQKERERRSYFVKGDAPKPWHCRVCHKGYSTQRGACDHYAAFHDGQGYSCDRCSASYVRKRDLIGHYNKIHLKTKPYKCKHPDCLETFSYHGELYRHWHIAHPDPKMKSGNNKTFECEHCSSAFAVKKYLTSHLAQCPKRPTAGTPEKCLICHKEFKIAKHLRNHMQIAHLSKGNKFYCEICKKVLTDKRNLTEHIKSHNGQGAVECKVCHKRFNRKAYLWTHMRVHTNERPYGCNFCPKWFKQYSTWKNHERTHTGEKPYKCQICSACFTTSSSVTKHIQYAHCDIREYGCHICNKRFITLKKLEDHVQVHTGEKPYECHICKKSFNKKNNLRAHMFVHSNNKKYKCEICGAGFMRRSTIENHILDSHQNVEYLLGSSACSSSGVTAAVTSPFITVMGAEIANQEESYIVIYPDGEEETEEVKEMQVMVRADPEESYEVGTTSTISGLSEVSTNVSKPVKVIPSTSKVISNIMLEDSSAGEVTESITTLIGEDEVVIPTVTLQECPPSDIAEVMEML